jgi:hypothetical protein
MHDSGVRRFKRAAGGWFKKGLSFVIPMAPRKHNDEQPQVDKSQIT